MKVAAKNSENYIKKMFGKKPGFKVPKGYFKEVDKLFFIKRSTSNFPKKTGFTTPENYFDSLESSILENYKTTKPFKKTRSLSAKIIRFSPFAVAASVLLFIGINYFSFPTRLNYNIENIAITEVEKWVQENINIINSNDLSLAFETSDFKESELIFSSVNNNEIEEYLQTMETLSFTNEIK
jgi:hypothetical protein